MTARRTTIKDENGNISYPLTIVGQVINPANGKNVEEELSELLSTIDGKAAPGMPFKELGRMDEREGLFAAAFASEGNLFVGTDNNDGFTHYIYRVLKSSNGAMGGLYVSSEEPEMLYNFRYNNNTGELIIGLISSEVIDALDSTLTDKPLSANQGRVLKGLVDAKYTKPTGGIDTADLSTNVKNALEKAKSAIQNVKTVNGVEITGTGNVNIPKGDKGDKGDATVIKGSYETYAELKAAHPVGNLDDAYLVSGFLYVWSFEENAWKNVGSLKGPIGQRGMPGRDGDKGDKMTYADLTEMDKNDLRQPLMVEVERANESSEESKRESMLAKVAAQEANDSAANTASAMVDIQAKIAQIIEMGGQSAADIIASLELANTVALLNAQVQQLEAERLFIVESDAWDSMSSKQRTEILEAHINVAIVEGGAGEGTHSFENGTLTLSENCAFENGILTLADCEFENNILTLKN